MFFPPIKDVVYPPSDQNTRIWRYIDFSKFCSLLAENSLFFSRADLLGDPFEGSYPKNNGILREQFSQLALKDVPEIKDSFSQQEKYVAKIFPKFVYINCWHMNPLQSAAMWSIYAKDNKGIAIQSTYGLLRDCLSEGVHISEVKYIDYSESVLPIGQPLSPFVYKRKSYEHERELRAIKISVNGTTISSETALAQPKGINEPVDFNRLIEKVFIAPYAEDWFEKVVSNISEKYGLPKSKVSRSPLEEEPFF